MPYKLLCDLCWNFLLMYVSMTTEFSPKYHIYSKYLNSFTVLVLKFQQIHFTEMSKNHCMSGIQCRPTWLIHCMLRYLIWVYTIYSGLHQNTKGLLGKKQGPDQSGWIQGLFSPYLVCLRRCLCCMILPITKNIPI